MEIELGLFKPVSWFRASMRQVLLAGGFFLGITVLRWLFKAHRQSEFDTYPPE